MGVGGTGHRYSATAEKGETLMRQPHARETDRAVRVHRTPQDIVKEYSTRKRDERVGMALIALSAGFTAGLLVAGAALYGLLVVPL